MKPNNKVLTAPEILDWALGIFEERVAAKGLELSDEAVEAYLGYFGEPAERAAATPRLFNRYWQNVHRMMRDLASLSVSSAEWARTVKVSADNVEAAIAAYQHIKPPSPWCNSVQEGARGRKDVASVA